MSHAVKRRHEPPRVVGDLLKAEALRSHEELASYYADVTPPAEDSRLFAAVSRYFAGA